MRVTEVIEVMVQMRTAPKTDGRKTPSKSKPKAEPTEPRIVGMPQAMSCVVFRELLAHHACCCRARVCVHDAIPGGAGRAAAVDGTVL